MNTHDATPKTRMTSYEPSLPATMEVVVTQPPPGPSHHTGSGGGGGVGSKTGTASSSRKLKDRATRERLTHKQLQELSASNRDKFPDPRASMLPMQFLAGIRYTFVGVRDSFVHGYAFLFIVQYIFVLPVVLAWILLSGILGVGAYAAPVNSLLGFIFKPLINLVIMREVKKLSYFVELKMNGHNLNAQDFFFGQGSDKEQLTLSQKIERFVKGIMDGIVKHGLKFIFKQLQRLVFDLIFSMLTMLIFLVPVIGPILGIYLVVLQLMLSNVLMYFDVVCSRKGMNTKQLLVTSWNNAALLAGISTGLVICFPLILFLIPIAVVACTHLLVHLNVHERTGFAEPWMNLPLNFGLFFGVKHGVKLKKIVELREYCKDIINTEGFCEEKAKEDQYEDELEEEKEMEGNNVAMVPTERRVEPNDNSAMFPATQQQFSNIV